MRIADYSDEPLVNSFPRGDCARLCRFPSPPAPLPRWGEGSRYSLVCFSPALGQGFRESGDGYIFCSPP